MELAPIKLSDTQRHYVYDCSLPVEMRALHKREFPTGGLAARWLGVSRQRIYTNRKMKHKIFSPTHNKWFAVRLAPDE